MQAVRQPDLRSHVRELQCGTPLLIIDLNEYTTITFDYNFGSGQKDILFGLMLQYYSGDEISSS